MKNPARRILIYFLILLSFFSLNTVVEAFPSSSTNYQLEGEFGIFGGTKTSDNYSLSDTGGGFAVGFGTSTNYRNCSGFQCLVSEIASITVSLGANSVNLGTLSTGSVNTGSHTISVTTNRGGYTSRVYEDDNLRNSNGDTVDDVGDGAVSAGSEEYGIATSDSGNDVTQDSDCGNSPYNATGIDSISNQKSVASNGSPTYTAEVTTICYSASRSGLTAAGNYQHIVTFITTGSF